MAGMPVGPLSLNDEVAVDLAWKILKATEADLGAAAVDPRQKKLLEEMVEKRGRSGARTARASTTIRRGGPKRLWPGLADLQPRKLDPDAIDVPDLKHRLLGIQALETARCFEEGVLTDVREADVGSILGFGFAPFSGGTLSYIDMMGTPRFVEPCRRLEASCGPRFAPSQLLLDMAAKGETFYGRFAQPQLARRKQGTAGGITLAPRAVGRVASEPSERAGVGGFRCSHDGAPHPRSPPHHSLPRGEGS